MQTPFDTILNLLIETPGNIIYHLALAFAILSSFQVASIIRRSRKDSASKRLLFGLGMLFLGQAILYLSSGLAWQNIIEERMVLPPLDRAIMIFSLVWIIWLWAFPTPARLGDLVTGFLNLGIVLLFLFSYTSWARENGFQHFNNTWIDRTWELAALILVLTGMAILLFSRPVGWEFGLGMLSLILAGTVAHLLLASPDQDYSSYMRLGQLAAFPLLPTLLNRLSQPASPPPEPADTKATPSLPTTPFPRTHERRRYSADPRTVHAWLSLINAKEPEQMLSGISSALSQTMLSDICFLASKGQPGQINLLAGYDLIREEKIPGTTLDGNNLPTLAASLQRGKILLLNSSDSQPQDLASLNAALGLKEAGSLLFIPLFSAGKPQGGILFLSPYSNRQWSVDDQGYLAPDLEIIASIIEKVQQPPAVPDQVPAARLDETLRVELGKLRQDNQLLLGELEEYRQKESQPAARDLANFDLDALVALQQESQDQISHLQAENERLLALYENSSRGNGPSPETLRIETELRRSLEDIAVLRNQIAEANARNLVLEHDLRKGGLNPEDRDVITSIAQEIRQPMASISGYTDLLLNESVGILGVLQRKFLERIEASIERLRSILDDLVRVTIMSEGPVELITQPIEFTAIVDGAMADTSAQLREKDIALRVDLPEEMPQIVADRDAIQQIILHLLQNAGAATPQESTITLRARVQNENEADFLLVQVTDSGGGIHAEDLPRVFSRNYRADRPLIQGLGDTGVGLSIAKTLVEAHGGRIWVDSQPGQGTTISVLLPMQPDITTPVTR